MFVIQIDTRSKLRGYRPSRWTTDKYKFKTINQAIANVKKTNIAMRILWQDEKGAWITIIFHDGVLNNKYVPSKIRTLYKVGELMYVPRRLVKKTSIRRVKRKK